MERLLVKNASSFFLLRYFSSIALCFLTLFITGRIGDIDFLLGFIQYGAGGTTSSVAKSIFSKLGFLGNRYLIICLIAFLSSITLFLLLKNFIDKKNINLWVVFLMSPGLLIYTNSVTKETLFIYPAILYIISECFYLTGTNSKSSGLISGLFLRFFLLLFMISIRGDLTIPYIILFFLSLILKNIFFGNLVKNFKFQSLLIASFWISLITTFTVIFFKGDYFSRTIIYLQSSFRYENLYRPNINAEFIRNPLNYFYIQYLSLFPTPMELIDKPYKFSIILDSLILFYSYSKAWKNLLKVVSPFKKSRQTIAILFIFITVVYFSLFGILGSFNLGSSQRLRTNYLPIGIIFPLVIEKMIRDKKLAPKSHS